MGKTGIKKDDSVASLLNKAADALSDMQQQTVSRSEFEELKALVLSLKEAVAQSSQKTSADTDRLLRLPEVLKTVGVGRTTWFQGVKKGIYPRRVQGISNHIAVWRQSEILQLVNN